MASKTPQYTIKVGADSVDYFSREVTASDVAAGTFTEDQIGLIQGETVESGDDIFNYPVLIRRTGDSFKGSTESIESNELRKGRTKSAPRKGNSSAEGSLDFELSPETYDDILEAALRGKWTKWISDTNSATNIAEAGEEKDTFEDGTFLSKETSYATGEAVITKNHKRLWATSAELTTIKADIKADAEAKGIDTSKWTEADYAKDQRYPVIVSDADLEVAELTCGTNDVKYAVLKHFGGVEGDDLYQEFQHMAVNTMSLSVTPGQIVTGSFGFMGANNPDVVQRGVTKDGIIESVENPTTGYADGDTPKGLIKVLSAWQEHESRFATSKDPAAVKAWIDNLPEKGTSSDQYTAREGFLYINGERVRYGSNLDFSLDNGLNKTFAIFEKDAIATSPMTLDVTGTLGVYLIKGYSENLYNLATQDKDVEVLFCFQEKEEDPESMYVVQIFKTKFTDTDLSSGAETLEVSFPFQSFEERACRIFRLRKRAPKKVVVADDNATLTVTFNDIVTETDPIKVKVAGVETTEFTATYENKTATIVLDTPVTPSLKGTKVTVELNGTEVDVVVGKIKIDNVEIKSTNNGLDITLTGEPAVDPEAKDFVVKVTVDGTPVENLAFDSYASGVATYTFDEVTQGDEDKVILATVTFNGYTKTGQAIVEKL